MNEQNVVRELKPDEKPNKDEVVFQIGKEYEINKRMFYLRKITKRDFIFRPIKKAKP